MNNLNPLTLHQRNTLICKDAIVKVVSSDLKHTSVGLPYFETAFTIDKDSRGRIYHQLTAHKAMGRMYMKSVKAMAVRITMKGGIV